jgi:hypothetical protein
MPRDTGAVIDNRQVVRRAFEAWQAGTAPITDLFADHMTWTIEGRSLASKAYGTKQQFVDGVLAPFGARFARGTPFRPRDIRAVHADGDTVVVLWNGHGVANDGLPCDNAHVWIMRLEGGLVVDGVAFFDSIAFDDLRTRVPPTA